MAINLGNIGYDRTSELNIQLDKYEGGTNLILRDTRLKENEASESVNLMLVQDGIWQQRWGSQYYGGDAGGARVDGWSEYIKTNGTRELIVVANGKVWRKNGDSWTEISGATFTAGTNCHLIQIKSFLYITNGTDSIARYDGSTLATYTERSAPAWGGTPLARGAGLATGNFTMYYQITTLNEVGETVANAEQSIAVDIHRDEWTAADEYITLDWAAATGADRYQIYWSDESGYETLIATIPATETTWDDDGSSVANTYIEVPDDNTTGGPMLQHLWLSDNRLWGTYDPDNEFRVHFTGTGQFLGVFSDYYGGGWIDLEKGGRNKPKAGTHFHDGKGTGRSTVFCSTPDGRGSVWQINIGDVTVGEETFVVPSAYKIVGSVGTDSPLSVVTVENDVFFMNRRGVYLLGNEPNYWGVLRTNELSVRIRPFIEDIDWDQVDDVCAYYHEGKVFFSVDTGGDGNNRIFYYDRERKCWVCYWTTGVNQFGTFTDTDNVTHFLGGMSTDGYMVEFSESFGGDLGVAFNTAYTSPAVPVDKDWTRFAKIKRAYIRIGQPEGNISVAVSGTQKNTGRIAVATGTIDDTVNWSNTGMGWDQMGVVQMGDTLGSPTVLSQNSYVKYLKVNKRLRDVQFRITTSDLNSKYHLLGLKAKGFPLDTRGPSSEKIT